MTTRTSPGPDLPVRDGDLEDIRRSTAILVRSLCEHLSLPPSWPTPPEPTLRPGPTRWTLEATATLVLREHPDGHRSLAGLAEALVGWRRRLTPGRVARLEARLGASLVEASYVAEEQVLVVTVVSPALPVTREQSLRLRSASSARSARSASSEVAS